MLQRGRVFILVAVFLGMGTEESRGRAQDLWLQAARPAAASALTPASAVRKAPGPDQFLPLPLLQPHWLPTLHPPPAPLPLGHHRSPPWAPNPSPSPQRPPCTSPMSPPLPAPPSSWHTPLPGLLFSSPTQAFRFSGASDTLYPPITTPIPNFSASRDIFTPLFPSVSSLLHTQAPAPSPLPHLTPTPPSRPQSPHCSLYPRSDWLSSTGGPEAGTAVRPLD